jgi:hypothetical protein
MQGLEKEIFQKRRGEEKGGKGRRDENTIAFHKRD